MTSFKDIIMIVTTFSAALLGIVGNTWNPKRRGIRKLTMTGWIAVVLALAGLYSTIDQALESSRQRMAAQQIQTVALEEIDDVTMHLMESFLVLIYDIGDPSLGEKYGLHYSLKPFDHHDFFDTLIYSVLCRDKNLEKINFHDIPRMEYVPLIGKPAWEIVSYHFKDSKEKIDLTLTRYGRFLSDDLVLSLTKLTTSEFYNFARQDLPIIAAKDSTHTESIGYYFGATLLVEEMHDQQGFLVELRKIRSLCKAGKKRGRSSLNGIFKLVLTGNRSLAWL